VRIKVGEATLESGFDVILADDQNVLVVEMSVHGLILLLFIHNNIEKHECQCIKKAPR